MLPEFAPQSPIFHELRKIAREWNLTVSRVCGSWRLGENENGFVAGYNHPDPLALKIQGGLHRFVNP